MNGKIDDVSQETIKKLPIFFHFKLHDLGFTHKNSPIPI
jgi:hypothetical protein